MKPLLGNLEKQQQQFDSLMSKIQAMVTTLQSLNAKAASTFNKGAPSIGMRGKGRMPFPNPGGRGAPGGGGPPLQPRWRGQPQPQRPNPQQVLTHPQQEQGNSKTYTESQCWQCGEVGHLKRSCPLLKGKGLLQGGNAWTAPPHLAIPLLFLLNLLIWLRKRWQGISLFQNF